MSILPRLTPRNPAQRYADIDRQLMRYEAEIGSQIFGPLPKGRTRKFFCLDERTWIWHEEWKENGQLIVVTTRYEARPNGVLKMQNDQVYRPLSREEARNFFYATEIYRKKVGGEYRRLLQMA